MDANIKFKKAWSDKGVSEVIGTILMLAITVVLFSTIMLAVMNIPTPSQRPSADFSATLKFTTPTDAYLNITHMGGETLFNYSTSIFILKGETTTAYYLADGGIPLTWSISQVWSIKLSSLTTSTRLEVRIIDLDSSSTVWTSMVSSGQTSSYPIILQRWVDANISTLTLDPIRSSDTKGFTFYVRVIDSDYDLNSTGVWVDASPVGGSSHKVRSAASGGVWEFVFDPASDPTSYDKKPLFIHAIDELGHESIESYVLSVQQPDITINEGDQNTYTNPPVGEEGLPSYMVYVHGDQGYVVLGEMNNTNVSREWGVEANTSDPKFIFTQGQEWVFIRVGSKILKNVDAKNMFSVRSLFSNEEIVPPSNSSGFSLLTVAGPAYIYQAKFNSSLLAPGAYNVFIDLLSSSVEGQAPARFMADFVLTILAQPGQEPIFVPTVTFWDKDRRIDGTAQQWGNKTTPYDLSDVSMSKVWVEIKMQTVGAAASASVYEVRILDMRGRTNLYGDPPTGDGMISAIGSDGTHVCYYFSVDLRLRNGVSYSAGMGAYTMRIVKIFDDNEGIYSISQPIWIRSAVSTKNFVVASSGFGLGDSSSNFMHIDYLFQIDNNKFFTTRVLEAADEDPGGGTLYNLYLAQYFDIDGDGDRDVVAAIDIDGDNHLVVYINRMNEYAIWEPRSDMTNYTDYASVITSIAYGDVDADGDLDWVVSTDAGKCYLYINDYPIRTIPIFTTGHLRYFQEIKLVDVTGDDRADLVAIGGITAPVARGARDCKLFIANLTRGTSITTTPVELDASQLPATNRDFFDFDVADIDYDGDNDIAIVSDWADSTYGARWYENEYTSSDAFATADPGTYTGVRVVGTWADTLSSNNVNEQIMESGHRMDYSWPVSTVSGQSMVLHFEARVNSGADDGFYAWFSSNAAGPWTFMFPIPSTTTIDTTFTFNLPEGTSGTIYVRITDSAASDTNDDSIYVDLIQVIGIRTVRFTTLHGLSTETTFTAIGIGEFDGYGYLDAAIGKGDGGASVAGVIKILNGTPGAPSLTIYTINDATVSLDGYTFATKDANGDGRADIITTKATMTTSPTRYYRSTLQMWINLGSGNSFNSLLIKDLWTSYGDGNSGGSNINCIAVENQYG